MTLTYHTVALLYGTVIRMDNMIQYSSTVTTIPGYSISRGMFIMFIGSRNGYPCTQMQMLLSRYRSESRAAPRRGPQPHPILLCDESMLQYDSCGNCVLIITFYLLFFVGSNYRSLNSTLAALWTSLTSTARSVAQSMQRYGVLETRLRVLWTAGAQNSQVEVTV